MTDISNLLDNIDYTGFVVLPLIEFTSQAPPDPYTLPTAGRIHFKLIKQLLSYLLSEQSDEIREQIVSRMSENYILETLSTKSDEEWADFCRHVLIINQSTAFIWGLPELMLRELGKTYQKQWEQPNFSSLINAYNEFGRMFIPIGLDKENLITYETIQKKAIDLGYLDEDSFIPIDRSYQKIGEKEVFKKVGNVLRIYELTANSEIRERMGVDHNKVKDLRNDLEKLIYNERKSPNYAFSALMLINTWLIAHTRNLDQNEVTRFFNDIEELYVKSKEEEVSEFYAAKIILGATFGQLSTSLFQTEIDFMSKRKLLLQLIDLFLDAKEYKLAKGFQLLIDETVSMNKTEGGIELFAFVINGYHQFSRSIEVHCEELPESHTKDRLSQVYTKLDKIIRKSIFALVEKIMDIEDIVDLTQRPDEFIKMLNTINHKRIKWLISNLMVTIFKHQIFQKRFDQPDAIGNVIIRIMENDEQAIRAELFELEYQLRTHTFPFNPIIEAISEEIEKETSIFFSNTFEEKIFSKINRLLGFVLENTYLGDEEKIKHSNTIILFAGELLQRVKEIPIYYEIIMMLAPIISISFVEVCKAYYTLSRLNSCFISFLNLHYFAELFVDATNRSTTVRTKKSDLTLDITEIVKKFENVIKDLEFLDQMVIQVIQQSISYLEMTFISDIDNEAINYTLDDDIIMGYNAFSHDFQEFLANKIVVEENSTLEDTLLSSQVYLGPSRTSMQLDELGLYTHNTSPPELPIPLFRKIAVFSASLKMFPIAQSIDEILSERRSFDAFIELYSGDTA